jgi:hypothetical protein
MICWDRPFNGALANGALDLLIADYQVVGPGSGDDVLHIYRYKKSQAGFRERKRTGEKHRIRPPSREGGSCRP